jgi:carbamoylphosphate synthase large subunit
MAQSTRPAVVFVDDSPLWHSFQQVAALVRRHGYHTVRVTTAPTGRVARLVDRLLYRHAIYLSDVSELTRLPELIAPLQPVKLCVTEPLLSAIDDTVLEVLPKHMATDLRVRRRLSDKVAAAELAAQCGALVPDQLPGSVPAAEAVHALGLPVVLKATYSAAGSGVQIAATLAQAEQMGQEMDAAGDFFYQRFVSGQILSYGAMVSDEGIVQEMTYRGIESSSNPTGAPLAYEVVDEPAFTDIAQSVCREVGIRGPINLQAIRDSAGRYWMIDLNIRPFGGMLNYDQNLVDTAAGFLFSSQLTDTRPRHRTAPPGMQISEFPIDAEELARTGRYGTALSLYLRRAPSFARLLRFNYLAFAVLNGVAHKLGI